jgi:folate-binding protein YgfZ
MVSLSEYELASTHAGLVERDERGQLLLTGNEAGEFLQGQVTNDILSLVPGSGCYAALLDHKGKMRADLRVLRGEGWIWIDCEKQGLDPLIRTIRTYSIGRDVRFEDRTEHNCVLSVIGPGWEKALDATPGSCEYSFVEGQHGLYVATDLGADVICERSRVPDIKSSLGIEPISEDTAECLRIESGRPRYGFELDTSTIPQEAGLNERAISFTKGCYVGQETVARLHYKGRPNRHLRGLRLSKPASRGDTVAYNQKQVGTVGSACDSPSHGPIALALLRKEVSIGDTVAVGTELEPAEVTMPQFSRQDVEQPTA